ncbi:liver carboxylesterase 1-like [Brevipalpus obovatus]|uniref:liver carboxylesterase 1-like n=1 Tax=Brevipalpus obovatus TaxID=246614 RepID=UPI003D9F2609
MEVRLGNALPCIFLIYLSLIDLSLCGSVIKTPVIKTHSGDVVGVIEKYDIGEVAYFFGIKYAKPPTGDLRFAKPQPADNWNDVFEATGEVNYCYEPPSSARFVRQKYSEDCLSLSIAAPPKALKEPGSRPVVVNLGRDYSLDTFHGYLTEQYPLAIKQDLVLVRVRSRRNIFGFAYTKDDDGLDGNYGLEDQNMALHWIQDNIKNFGGNPNKVTILGSGASGQLAAAHVISPYGRGLFQNVIIQTRSFQTLNSNRNERIDETTNIVIDRVGCKDAKDVRKCLQSKDAEELLKAIPRRLAPFEPVINSDYIPLTQEEINAHALGKEPTDMPNINVLLGYSQNEASFHLTQIAPNIFSDAELTREDALDVIERLFDSSAVDKIAEMYIGDINQPLSIGKIQKGLSKLVNDILITCPLVLTGVATSTGQKKGQTYFLVFNHIPNYHVELLCNLQQEEGICPADITSFEFGAPYTQFSSRFSDEDRKMTDKMQNIIGTFARTGKPPQSNEEWPSYNSKPDKYPALILTSKKDTLDYSIGKYCVENAKFLDDSLIDPKYYPLDEFTIPKQKKIDYRTTFKYVLENQLYYGAFQNY